MAAMNDWLVAGINNPDMTVSDMADFAGMTVDNTQFLSADEYKKYDFVQNNDMFKNEQGQFDENLFNNYYSMRADEFNTFVSNDFYRGPALDVFDIDRTADTPVADNGFNITRGFNPNRQQIGIEGVNVWSAPTFSQRELAKQNKIFNTETGEFEDYSVDDHTLVKNPVEWFKDLWKDPLVLATWDEDGTHIDPTTGIVQQHVKGEAKLNDKGTYYYETLGDRSVLGKDVLSMFDTLTVDGEGLNKYDFFDSNDLKKSVGGTIMKSVMNALPMFIPYVGTVYSAVTMGRELTKTLPMLTGMVTSLTGGDTPEWAEKAAAWGKRASFSMSDRAMQNTFNFEHFANLVSDLALLTGQQKLIAQTLGGLRGGAKYIEEAQAKANALFQAELPKYANRLGAVSVEDIQKACLNKFLPQAQKMAQKSGQLGRDAGLAYIALTMQSGTYDEMLQKGATKKEASAVALGATLGMFSVDKWLHLGELFYNDYTGDTTKFIKKLMRDKVGEMSNEFKNAVRTAESEKKGLMATISNAKDKVSKWMKDYSSDLKYHTTTATGKIIGGGVERITEEMCSDLSKGLYALAGVLGYDASVKPEDVGVFENAGDRYLMTFLGGALGAGIFYGKEIMDRGSFKAPKIEQNFETLIRNGYADEMRAEVDRLEKEGKTGSKKLMSIPDDVQLKDGKVLFRTTEDQALSQSKFIADKVRDEINIVDEAINSNEHSAMNDDEVFENLIMGEARLRRYQELAGMTGYFQENGNRIHNYVEAYKNLKKAKASIDGKPDSEEATPQQVTVRNSSVEKLKEYNDNVAEAQKKYDTALQRMTELHSGDYCLDYTRMLSFALDPEIHEDFLSIDRDSYCKSLYNGKTVDQLQIDEMIEFLPKWEEYKKNNLKTLLPKAYETYKEHGIDSNKVLKDTEKGVDAQIKFNEKLGDILTGKEKYNWVLDSEIATYDTRFNYESDEMYDARYRKYKDPITGKEESDAEFASRVASKERTVKEWNMKREQRLVDELREELEKVNYSVDSMSLNRIKRLLGEYGRPKEIINRALREKKASTLAVEAFNGLKNDLSNAEEVIDKLKNSAKEYAEIEVGKQRQRAIEEYDKEMLRLKDMKVEVAETDENGEETVTETSLYDYLNNTGYIDEAETIGDFIEGVRDFYAGKGGFDFLDKLTNDSENAVRDLVDYYFDGNVLNYDVLRVIETDDVFNGGALSDVIVYSPEGKKALEEYISRKLADFNPEQYINDAVSKAEQEGVEIVSEIEQDPIIKLLSDLKNNTSNPAEEIVNAIAKARGIDVSKSLSGIFKEIWNNYDGLKDINDFFIDDSVIENIENVLDIISETKTYMRAASVTPTVESPFGHNKSINEFADKNASKLTKPWNKLPELRSDAVMLYEMELNRAERELKNWIEYSNSLQLDRSKKIRATDEAISGTMSRMLYDKRDRTISVGGKKYKIFEGYEKIDLADLNNGKGLKVQYKLEKLLYDNLDRIAAENKMTIVDLVKNSDLIEQLVPGLSELDNQIDSKVNESFTLENFTPFSQMVYIASVLSERPAAYYNRMKDRITGSESFVPIGAQDIAARGMQAMVTGNFSKIIDHVYEKIIPAELRGKLPKLENFFMLQGAAGVGKTFSGFVSADSMIKDKKVFMVAPALETAKKLASTLNRDVSSCKTIEELLKWMLPEKTYEDIEEVLNKPVSADIQHQDGIGNLKDKDGKNILYFTADNIDAYMVARIVESNISFNDIAAEEIPDVIYIDEVTNVNSVYAQIINLFARQHGIKIGTAGDMTQITANTASDITSVQQSSVFMARAPELTLSMRNGNLQKTQNEKKTKLLADLMIESSYNLQNKEHENAEYKRFKDLASKLNVSAYIGDDINGDYITKSLNDNVINLLKNLSESKTVAFIGEQTSSVLSELRNAGVRIADVLTLNKMKGQEYDYVVSDVDFRNETYEGFGDLLAGIRKFYTLSTRAREGTIFIDNSVSELFGQSKIVNNKSKAPNVLEATKALRDAKIGILNELDFSDYAIKSASDAFSEKPGTDTGTETGTDTGTDTDTGVPGTDTGVPGTDTGASGTDTGTDTGTPKKDTGVIIGGGLENSSLTTKSDPIGIEMSLEQNPEERAKTNQDDILASQNVDLMLMLDASLSDRSKIESDVIKDFDPENMTLQVGNDNGTGENNCDIGINLGKKGTPGVEYESYGFNILSVQKGEQIKNEPQGVFEWIIDPPSLESGKELRNIQALVEKKVKVTDYNSKRVFENQLSNIIDGAVFNHAYDDLPRHITDNFNKKAWDSKRFVLEFRYSDTENDTLQPVFSPFKKFGMTVDGAKRTIYANYVLMLKNKKGQVCKFDICGLNDPKTLKENLPEIKRSLDAAIKKLNNPGENKAPDTVTANRLQKTLDGIDTAADDYGMWFKSRYDELVQSKKDYIQFDVNDNLVLNMRTWAKRRNGTPVRLDGYVDPGHPYAKESNNKGVVIRNTNNFIERYKSSFSISPVYILTSNACKELGLEPNMKGAAVIFYSSDTILKSNELASKYVEEHQRYFDALQKGEEYVPAQSIRIAKLENYGLTWSEICNDSYFADVSDIYKTTKIDNNDDEFADPSKAKKPLNMNYTGSRMYASLWNARASLHNFLKKLNDWQTKNGFTDEQVRALAQAQDTMYRMKNESKSSDEINRKCAEILERRANGNPTLFDLSMKDSSGKPIMTVESLIKLVDDFNNVDLLETPMFRLGHYRNNKQLNIGYHVQSYDVKNSKLYKGKTYNIVGNTTGEFVNLCSITKNAADKMMRMLDAVLEPLSGKRDDGTKPLIWFGKKMVDSSGNESVHLLEKGEYIDVDETTDNTGKVKTSKSGLKALKGVSGSFVGKKIVIEGMEYDGNNFWSMIPRLLKKMSKQSYSMTENGTGSRGTKRKFKYYNSEDIEKKKYNSFEIDYDGLIDKGSEGGNMYDMLNMIFHGTLQDIHMQTNADNQLIRMTDAQFKYGFLINPGAEVNTGLELKGSGGNVVLYPCGTGGSFFTLNIIPMKSSIRIDSSELMKFGNTVKAEDNETILNRSEVQNNASTKMPGNSKPVTLKTDNSVLLDLTNKKNINDYISNLDPSLQAMSLDKIKETIRKSFVSDCNLMMKSSDKKKVSESLKKSLRNKKVDFDYDKDEVLTLQNLFDNLLPGDSKISIEYDGKIKKFIARKSDSEGNTMVFDFETGKMYRNKETNPVIDFDPTIKGNNPYQTEKQITPEQTNASKPAQATDNGMTFVQPPVRKTNLSGKEFTIAPGQKMTLGEYFENMMNNTMVVSDLRAKIDKGGNGNEKSEKFFNYIKEMLDTDDTNRIKKIRDELREKYKSGLIGLASVAKYFKDEIMNGCI